MVEYFSASSYYEKTIVNIDLYVFVNLQVLSNGWLGVEIFPQCSQTILHTHLHEWESFFSQLFQFLVLSVFSFLVSSGCVVVLHSRFSLHFLMANSDGYLFMYFLIIHIFSFVRCSLAEIILLIFECAICFLIIVIIHILMQACPLSDKFIENIFSLYVPNLFFSALSILKNRNPIFFSFYG